jgi:hypothetical protein
MQTEVSLLILKGAISEMSETDQDRVRECAGKLRETVKEYGDRGLIAMALVDIEVTLEQEKAEKK